MVQRYYFYQKKEQFIDDFLNSVITKLFFYNTQFQGLLSQRYGFFKEFC